MTFLRRVLGKVKMNMFQVVGMWEERGSERRGGRGCEGLGEGYKGGGYTIETTVHMHHRKPRTAREP